ncbi:hypothetical protein Ciccas_014151 [Cichlidogyrus casuarinus]|uniref:Uncharacterized protein n=1 Tax=Cichlidogyrus casuarinus TaxID=1844966 RepID=A0ABD2PJE7_9PLAT
MSRQIDIIRYEKLLLKRAIGSSETNKEVINVIKDIYTFALTHINSDKRLFVMLEALEKRFKNLRQIPKARWDDEKNAERMKTLLCLFDATYWTHFETGKMYAECTCKPGFKPLEAEYNFLLEQNKIWTRGIVAQRIDQAEQQQVA